MNIPVGLDFDQKKSGNKMKSPSLPGWTQHNTALPGTFLYLNTCVSLD